MKKVIFCRRMIVSMPVTFEGDSFPKVFPKGGQKLYIFSDYYLFILENDVYRTAGHQHWKNKVSKGWRSEGIGLNTEIMNKVFGDASKEFFVYDKKNNRCFKLEDRVKAVKNKGEEEKGMRKIQVLPLESFEKGFMDKVPDDLRGGNYGS